MENEKLYKQAIEIAVDAEARFLAAHEANKSFSDNRTLQEKHRQIKVQPAAAIACAQQEMIASLFCVSDEKVHEDISKLLAGR